MKSLMLLWKMMANDCAIRCHTSTTLDLKKVESRTEHEGLSFLTITLPNFGKDFEKSLDRGYVDRYQFQGFSWNDGLPRFLGGFLDLVFDRSSGRLLDQPSIDAIRSIRQLTLLFGKMQLPCSDARMSAAFDGYVQCEMDVRHVESQLEPSDYLLFGEMADVLFGEQFSRVDELIFDWKAVPRHGPGATAGRVSGNQKYVQTEWTRRLQEIFPREEFLIPNSSFMDRIEDSPIHEPGSEMPVRVISVPKTLKTPRIIGIEPVYMQYVQQALLPMILKSLKTKPWSRRMLGFEDQTPNQRMALNGSLYGNLATLDLSEASDRVSNQLVLEMTRRYPQLHEAVQACRSRKADVPGHGVQRLAKFASMGSALCFPFEAMVFLTIIFLGIQKELNRPLTRRDLKRLTSSVRVYGDDIIIPVEYVSSVVSELQHFGAVVNTGKSFWTGKFRESCGKEYYDGEDVSIVRCRRNFPTHRKRVSEVISLVELRNQLYFAGYWGTCKWLDEEIGKILKYFPVVLPSSPVLGRHSFLPAKARKIGGRLHNPLVKGWSVRTVIPKDPLDDYGALLKWFLKQGPAVVEEYDLCSREHKLRHLPKAMPDPDHLKRAGRAQDVDIKLGWTSVI